jgi:anti-sigma factor ChrR (cupin superfamily)
MKRTGLMIFLTMALSASAIAQSDNGTVLLPADLQWQLVMEGVEIAVANGDWTSGPHEKYVRLAAGLSIPLHTHSSGFTALVVSGTFSHTFSDEESPEPLPAGSYFSANAGVPHINTCISEEPCVVFTIYDGLHDVTMLE